MAVRQFHLMSLSFLQFLHPLLTPLHPPSQRSATQSNPLNHNIIKSKKIPCGGFMLLEWEKLVGIIDVERGLTVRS